MIALAGLGAGCYVTEADVQRQLFATYPVRLELPVPGAEDITVEREVLVRLAGANGFERRTVSRLVLRLRNAGDRPVVDLVEWASDATDHRPVAGRTLPVESGTIEIWPGCPDELARLLPQAVARATRPWRRDIVEPRTEVISGTSWVVDVTDVLADPIAGPLAGARVEPRRSSAFAQATGHVPWTESITWDVELHARLTPLELPQEVSALVTARLGAGAAEAAARAALQKPPQSATASIRARQEGLFPPRRAGQVRHETLRLHAQWKLDERTLDVKLVERRVRRGDPNGS